jgi:pentatricopeptide repeat protein
MPGYPTFPHMETYINKCICPDPLLSLLPYSSLHPWTRDLSAPITLLPENSLAIGELMFLLKIERRKRKMERETMEESSSATHSWLGEGESARETAMRKDVLEVQEALEHMSFPSIPAEFLLSLECTNKHCPLMAQKKKGERNCPAFYLTLYSNALVCLTFHKKNIEKILPEDLLCILGLEETFLSGKGQVLKKITENSKNCMDLYCEQDVESLTMRIYEKLTEAQRREILKGRFVGKFLSLLRTRKEWERFFSVYGRIEKRDMEVYKIALLASIETEQVDPRSILKEVKAHLRVPENDPESGEAARYEELKKWFSEEYRKHHWKECMRIWESSRGMEGAAESMIDVCIKYREFEEGWKVYNEALRSGDSSIHKLSVRGCYMGVKALNYKAGDCWRERFLAVITASMKTVKPLFLRQGILMLSEVEDGETLLYLTQQTLKIYHESRISGEGVKCALEGCLCLLEKREEASFRNGILDSVFSLYSQWKRKRHGFLRLFFKSSECTSQIYMKMLCLCCICEKKERAQEVCEDMWNYGLEMNEEILEHLRSLHKGECDCDKFARASGKKGHGRNILDHCVKILKKK